MLEGLRHHLGHHSGAQLGDRGWSLFKAQSPPLRPQGRPCNLHVLTIVGIRLDGAEAQVPTEECHGWVLALGTLAGHVAVRGKLGAKRVEWLPTPPSRWARMDSICTQPLPWAVPILSRVEDTLFRAPILSLGVVLSTFNTFPYYLISQRAPRSWCLCASTLQEKAEAQRGSGTAGPLTPLQGLSTSLCWSWAHVHLSASAWDCGWESGSCEVSGSEPAPAHHVAGLGSGSGPKTESLGFSVPPACSFRRVTRDQSLLLTAGSRFGRQLRPAAPESSQLAPPLPQDTPPAPPPAPPRPRPPRRVRARGHAPPLGRSGGGTPACLSLPAEGIRGGGAGRGRRAVSEGVGSGARLVRSPWHPWALREAERRPLFTQRPVLVSARPLIRGSRVLGG